MSMTDAEIRAYFTDPKNTPPSSGVLGFEFIGFSVEEGWAEMAFTASKSFTNPIGTVQGGFVSAMLDEAMGVAALIRGRLTKVYPTLQLNVTFVQPVPFERVIARGQIVRMGTSTALLTGTLSRLDGTLLANATATAIVRDRPGTKRAAPA